MSSRTERVVHPLLALLAALSLFASAEPVQAQGVPIDFSAVSDVPYGPGEEPDLAQHIADHNLYSSSEFFVHLGDLKEDDPICLEAQYTNAVNLLGALGVPTFVVPGDNEWTDCSDQNQGWAWWTTHLLGFEESFCGAPDVEAQIARPENFAFVKDGVLFIGIHHVGGTNQDPIEQAARLQDDADWVSQQMLAKVAVVRAAVVFAHESPLVEPFESGFRAAAATFAKPVAYIHGDNRDWKMDFPFPEPNIQRIQLERGLLAEPPIRVTVTMDQNPANAFVVERDPWPAGSSPLNRAPCADAGPDFIADVGVPSNISGLIGDDGVPAMTLTTIWSAPSGPGNAIFGNIFLRSTTVSFDAPGVYQLQIEADDGVISSVSDLHVLVRGSSGSDGDSDGADDDVDNCPAITNAGQADFDADGFGDGCDPDVDGDGYDAGEDCDDNDASVNPNPLTAESCGDAIDNNCDGSTDAADLQCGACPAGYDADLDGVCDWNDICPADFDPGQEDTDGDTFGDACDVCPASATLNADPDADGLCDDNCPAVWNPTQDDVDADGVGDVCDACDLDGSGGSCSSVGVAFNAPVVDPTDDAEEKVPSGVMSLTSSDLDIVNDNDKLQLAGLRFQGLAIPQAATIHRAYIQFTADEVDLDPATLMIEGEAADDSAPFTALPFDLSGRLTTTEWAGWSPLGWLVVGDAGARQRTSDLSGVVQEIVDRSGWTSGAALTLLISGLDTASTRVADTRDASPVNAPVLHIDYTPNVPIVAITSPGDGSAFFEGALLTFTASALDPQEGNVAASLVWESDLDGTIGSGATFGLSTLSVGTHTITASAMDSQGHTGVAGISLTVNVSSVPAVAITSPLNGSITTETDPITFTGTALDAEDGDLTASLSWTSDLDGPIGSGGTFGSGTLSVGTHTISASVTDSNGNPGSAEITLTVNANAAPVVGISSPLDGSFATEGDLVLFTGSATDAEDGDLTASLSWSSDLDGVIGAGASFPLTTLSVGTHLVTASLTDSHGAPGAAAITLTVNANAAPVVGISSPLDGSSSTEADLITFTGSATDAEDGDLAASLSWSSDLDGVIGAGASFPLTTLSVGTHLVTASLTDSHGAPGAAAITLTVNANVAPVVSITSPSTGSASTEADEVTFTGTALDAQDGDLSAGLSWTSDLDGAIGSGASFPLTTLSIGTHLISASVTDSHGALGFTSISITVNANSAPVVGISSPADGSTWTETDPISFQGSALDAEDGDLAAGLAWASDLDGPIGSGASFAIATLSVGTHQVSASVTDGHGAPGSSFVTVTVAPNTAPNVTIVAPIQGSYSLVGSPLAIEGFAFDVEDGDLSGSLSWSSDLDGAIGSGQAFVTSTLSEGTHLLTASVTDSHGMTGAKAITTIRLPEPGSEGLLAGLLGLGALARRRRARGDA